MFNIRRDKPVRMWTKYMSNTYEELSQMENTVQDAGPYQNRVTKCQKWAASMANVT